MFVVGRPSLRPFCQKSGVLTMQLPMLITLLVAALLLAVIFASIRSRANAEQVVRDGMSSLANTVNSRLDSVQLKLLTHFNATLQMSAIEAVRACDNFKEETRSRIDERVGAFTTDLRSAFDLFREQIEGRFGVLGTQLTAATSELRPKASP